MDGVEVHAVGADRSVLIMRGDIAWGGSVTEVVGRLLQPMLGPPQRRRELRRLKAAIESWNGSTSERQPHLGEEG